MMTIHTAVEKLRRARELGPRRFINRVMDRSRSASRTVANGLRWGVRARRGMSDSALLHHLGDRFASAAALRSHFAWRTPETFLLPHADPYATRALLDAIDTTYIPRLIGEAEATRHGEIDLLGWRFQVDSSDAWHTDPASGLLWPLLIRERMDAYLWSSGEPPADTKLVWELNRHQYLLKLALAAYITDDTSYTDTLANHLRRWIDSNPVGQGINWYSSLEIGLRLIAWTLIYQFIRATDAFDDTMTMAFLKSLYAQTDFLRHHLTTDEAVPNNHLIGEAAALVLVGAVFPEFRAAADWEATGLRHLTEQAQAQTFPDGINREQATGYHRFVTEFLILVAVAARRDLITMPPTLDAVLRSMLNAAIHMHAPDGDAPMWGDADDGSAHGLTPPADYWHFAALTAVGAALYSEPAWQQDTVFSIEAAWLTGTAGWKAWRLLPGIPRPAKSYAFTDAGHYILRQKTNMAVLRAGQFGLSEAGPCSHAHCDLLGVHLWLGGRALLVDSGTFTYYGTERDHFRLTAAHNTLMINDREQAEPGDPFSWRTIPVATVEAWEPDSHVVTQMVIDVATHRRRVSLTMPGQCHIIDTITSSAPCTLRWHFHLAPELHAQHDAITGDWKITDGAAYSVWLHPPADINLQLETGWYSRHYNARTAITVLVGYSALRTAGKAAFTWAFSQHSST